MGVSPWKPHSMAGMSSTSSQKKGNNFNHHLYGKLFQGQGVPDGSETIFYDVDVAINFIGVFFFGSCI